MKKKDTIELCVLAVLLMVLVTGIFRVVQRRANPVSSRTKTSARDFSGQGIKLNSISPASVVVPEEVSSDSLFDRLSAASSGMKIDRDPFFPIPIEIPEDKAPVLVFSGILWDEGDSMAIINDNLISVGDTIGPYRVVDISQDQVTLNDGSGDLVLRLGQE